MATLSYATAKRALAQRPALETQGNQNETAGGCRATRFGAVIAVGIPWPAQLEAMLEPA
jgi:hypothetical protein